MRSFVWASFIVAQSVKTLQVRARTLHVTFNQNGHLLLYNDGGVVGVQARVRLNMIWADFVYNTLSTRNAQLTIFSGT